MKLLQLFCCLTPGVGSGSNLCWSDTPDEGSSSSRTAEEPLAAAGRRPTSAAGAPSEAEQAACNVELGDGPEVAAVHVRLGSRELCSCSGATAAQGGLAPGHQPDCLASMPLPEELAARRTRQSRQIQRKSSDHLSVARQGLEQLMFDLRFRPGEGLPLASFCGPSPAAGATATAAATGPGAVGPEAAGAVVAHGPLKLLRRQKASSTGAVPPSAAAAAPEAQLPSAGASPQRQRHSSLQWRRTGGSSTGDGSGDGAAVPRRRSSGLRGASAGDTAAAQSSMAWACAGGGGAGPRNCGSAGSAGHRNRTSNSSQVSVAASWMLQQSLRPRMGAGSACSATRLAVPFAAAAAAAGMAAPALAASFGSSVSLSHPLFPPLGQAAAAPSPPPLRQPPAPGPLRQPPAPGPAGAEAEAAAVGGEAYAEDPEVAWAIHNGPLTVEPSMSPSITSATSTGSVDAEALTAGPVLVPTHIALSHMSPAQLAAVQTGDSDLGRGLGCRGAPPAPPPPRSSAVVPAGCGAEDAAGRRSPPHFGPSDMSRAAAVAPSDAAAPALALISAVAAECSGMAGGGSAGGDGSLGSTRSVSLAGLGAAYWVESGAADPQYTAPDVTISDFAIMRTTPVLASEPSRAPVVAATCDTASANVPAAASRRADAGVPPVTDAVMSLSSALRRSASVPIIVMERPEEILGAVDARSGKSAGARATGAADSSGATTRALLAASRPVSFLLRGALPRKQQHQQQPTTGWRTPLMVLPAVRPCSLSPAQSSAGGAAAAANGATSGSNWRIYRRSQNLSGKCGSKYRSGGRWVTIGLQSSGGAGGGAVSGVCVSSGVLGLAGGGDGSGPHKGSGSGGRGSGGRTLQPPPAAAAVAAAGGGAAMAPPHADVATFGKAPLQADTLAEVHGLLAAPAGQRHLPYASRHMSQMALLPFLQHQSNSTAFHVISSPAPASFNLAALSREFTGLRWIGQGGGGVVFQGVWQGVCVAVKFLLTEADGRVEAAALEGVVSTVVNHPNVLHTYAFECTRLTESSFTDSEAQQGSVEEGGTELLESLMESYTTISDSLNAVRRTRWLQGLAAGGGGAAAVAPGAVGACTPQRLSRLGASSVGDISQLTSLPLAAAGALPVGARGSSDWVSAGLSPAAAEGNGSGGAAAAAASGGVHTGTGQACTGCSRSVPLISPPAVSAAAPSAAAAIATASGGGGGGDAVPPALRSWFVDVLGPPGPSGHQPLSPPRSPSATPRGRAPRSQPRSPPTAAVAAAAAAAAAPAAGCGSTGADVDVIIATTGGCGAGAGLHSAMAVPSQSRPLSPSAHGANGTSAPGGSGPPKANSMFHSEDGFGDPEACLGSHCWTVRQVLSYLKARPGMYMTHIIMEYCERGSLLSAIKRGMFRTDSTWPDEEDSAGASGRPAAGGGGAALWTSSPTIGRVVAAAAPKQHNHNANAALATADAPRRQPLGSASRRVVFRALLRTARDVAQGMCHLHANGIIHGDLKPGNVLLRGCRSDRRGFVAVVSDFGLSKVTRGEKPLDLNHWSTVTVMAPEVILGSWLKASDVFSFGILLWQLVTGEIMPYGTCTVPQILVGVSQGTLKPEWPSTAHPALVRLGRACLATSPEKRPKFEAIVKVLTKIEKDVRSQLQQLQSPPPAAAAAGTRRSPQPAAPASAAHGATQRPRGAAAAAAAATPHAGGAAAALVPAAAAAARLAGAGGGSGSSSSDPRAMTTDWPCTAGSATHKRGFPVSTGSTMGFGFGFGFGSGGTGGGVDCGIFGDPPTDGSAAAAAAAALCVLDRTTAAAAAAAGCCPSSAPHTARVLRML